MACSTSARLLIAHRPSRLVRSPSRTRRVGGPTLKFLNAHRARGCATTFYVSSQSAMLCRTLIFPLLMTALSRTANADEGAIASPSKPAVIEADEQRLQWVLDTASTKARWGRGRSAAFDGVLLAVVVPPGVILSTRADAGLQMAGVGVLASGYWPLVGLLTSFFPSDMEALHARYEMRKASGADPAVVVRETEDDFRQLAARPRGPRPWLVAVDLLFGGGLAAYGSYLLLGEPNEYGVRRAVHRGGCASVRFGHLWALSTARVAGRTLVARISVRHSASCDGCRYRPVALGGPDSARRRRRVSSLVLRAHAVQSTGASVRWSR